MESRSSAAHQERPGWTGAAPPPGAHSLPRRGDLAGQSDLSTVRARPGTLRPAVRLRPPTRRPGELALLLRRVQSSSVQLTARGAVLGLFAACLVTLLLAAWTGWTAIADLAFVAGCAAAARYTRRGALLPVAVSPPLIFLAASVLAQLLTAAGTLGVLTGIFVTLGTSATWLFLGTAVALVITVSRGLIMEVRDYVQELLSVLGR